MKNIKNIGLFFILSLVLFTGCSFKPDVSKEDQSVIQMSDAIHSSEYEVISVGSQIIKINEGLEAVSFEGEDGFEQFISSGGASSDQEVIEYVATLLQLSQSDLNFNSQLFGCSTISILSKDSEQMFGRNFDWTYSNAMIVFSNPTKGYRSISTVNKDFISGLNFKQLPEKIQAQVALYAPLDGMNEKGLAISVNMISDYDTIEQVGKASNLTTTTAIRLILNNAATVDEAIELLQNYNLHASRGYMIHFAISDQTGISKVVEYIDNQMVVVDSPILTNFYLSDGVKKGIGSEQSHVRFGILEDKLKSESIKDLSFVIDALKSVSKANFGEFESTEWSIVFNQTTGEVIYFHRENYDDGFVFQLEMEK